MGSISTPRSWLAPWEPTCMSTRWILFPTGVPNCHPAATAVVSLCADLHTHEVGCLLCCPLGGLSKRFLLGTYMTKWQFTKTCANHWPMLTSCRLLGSFCQMLPGC